MSGHEVKALNANETFLLLLVGFGLATPYDLQSNAGLGPGLTSPALKRLAEDGLLTSIPGPRRSVRYSATTRGVNAIQHILSADRSNLWAFVSADPFGSMARGMVLAWLSKGPSSAREGIENVVDYLAHAAQRSRRDAEEFHSSMLRLQLENQRHDLPAYEGKLLGTVYQWLNAEADASLFGMQADAARKMLGLIDHLPAREGLVNQGEKKTKKPVARKNALSAKGQR